MPSERILTAKKQIVEDLANELKTAAAGVLIEYKGITVEQDTALRKEYREAGVNYKVVKNTLTRFAAEKVGFDFGDVLNGTTALATSDDPITAAKIAYNFGKKAENYTIKAGFVDGQVVSLDEINELATIPSKEVLISQVLYSFNYPLTQLAVAISEIAKKAETGEEAPANEEVPAETTEVKAEETAETETPAENAEETAETPAE